MRLYTILRSLSPLTLPCPSNTSLLTRLIHWMVVNKCTCWFPLLENNLTLFLVTSWGKHSQLSSGIHSPLCPQLKKPQLLAGHMATLDKDYISQDSLQLCKVTWLSSNQNFPKRRKRALPLCFLFAVVGMQRDGCHCSISLGPQGTWGWKQPPAEQQDWRRLGHSHCGTQNQPWTLVDFFYLI